MHLHVVSFNIPFPADYGGVIDVYYKLKYLSEAGVKIHLHCYEYGRKHAEELNKICYKVYYYKRHSGIRYFLNKLPYIVVTRQSQRLLKQLAADTYPILYEGLHTTWPLHKDAFPGRKQIIRAHNIEHEYYENLQEHEPMIHNKMFFRKESAKLRAYESIMNTATGIAAISIKDFSYFSKIYPHTLYVPAFHSYEKIFAQTGHGEYCLFHGDLSVSANIKAASFLIKKVFHNLQVPLMIAGKNPPASLLTLADGKKNIKIFANPSNAAMQQQITHAHINILPAYHASGLKLKLLSALYTGRHCLVNPPMLEGSGLDEACHRAETADDFKKQIAKLMQVPFEQQEISKRQELLTQHYSNRENAKKLMEFMYK